eukprot:TRINITY_DN24229_c0_g1_i5.p1 TRINITY_DN24229_c0_g1~~TRINITY_DN24229_c0_g1_i5.p1  ORF type:complete len:171 (+),score=18.92 TRINITY_DN24229_c0_g1_i5:28-513(+)
MRKKKKRIKKVQENKDQNRNNDNPYSLVGGGAQNLEETLGGLLGNSASPLQDLDASTLDELLPGSSRGRIVVHSAGTNGLFLGTKERASKNYDAEARGLRYGSTYYTDGANRRTDASGATGTADLIEGFDDIILTFGNQFVTDVSRESGEVHGNVDLLQAS